MQHTRCCTADDLRQVQQPVGDVLMLESNAAEMFTAVDVPRADRYT